MHKVVNEMGSCDNFNGHLFRYSIESGSLVEAIGLIYRYFSHREAALLKKTRNTGTNVRNVKMESTSQKGRMKSNSYGLFILTSFNKTITIKFCGNR